MVADIEEDTVDEIVVEPPANPFHEFTQEEDEDWANSHQEQINQNS